MIKHDIQIIIVDDSKRRECDIQCGVDWSSAEAISLAKQQIKDRFGDRIRLGYLDLSKPASALELSQKFKDLPLPSLLINGEPRISGQFDFRMLFDAIDTEIEIKP